MVGINTVHKLEFIKRSTSVNRGASLLGIYVICLALLYPSHASSQNILDHATLECQYDYAYMKDTTKNVMSDDRLVLLVGEKMSKCYSYYSMQIDSIFASPQKDELLRNAINYAFKTNTDYPHKRMKTYVYKNYPEGRMTVTDGLVNQDYVYEDEMNNIGWSIGDSMRVIMGYQAQNATCTYRGHKWTAWFSPDIPVMDGPWKLHGLPGLVMEAYDTGRHHCFKLVGIRHTSGQPIVFSRTYVGTCKFEKISREKFVKLQRKYAEDMSGMIQMETGLDIGMSASSKQLPYQLLEDE